MPEAEQAAALSVTLHTVNEAANWVSAVAFERGVPREYELRKHTYGELRARGLGAQAAQHVIKKTRDAYTTLKANIKAGNLGKPGSKRRVRAGAKPVTFRREAAQPYDDRCLSWQYDAQTVSVWTTAGRIRHVRFACSPDALKTLREHRQGESDLIERDGVFYLMATCDVPEAEQYEPGHFNGVDLGIANIATTSTGYQAAGRGLNRHRKRQLDLRRKLQAKGTKSAKRRLKARNRREQRHAKNQNHIIAKTIVTEAERTSAGISLEELHGIRQRVRLRKPQRVALHSWAFAQLADFIVYKARRAGVPVVFVDPAYTSQQCCECGHIDKKNRASQALFTCRNCGVVAHADRNASHNIARRGEAVWTAGRESRVPATP
ncbi:IS200/IS605 family element transposase accessory protein TnpB [Streptomyces sp. RLB3-17]|nr:IS200/IS605 family element transposase accessory protein TnpB [Streptomyces sp. RLB3-6]QDO04098.1 IS200/IS605 family element transposase accessory protein TnpB [Streptomyces sp. RLB1-9]QDO14203.1 IS200/IS605 family element transposase accessory protein TnpB [Streptomyces sp. S1D4-23]QDO25889.1 IS200/IS605 family element transposase accessory protein TnpB [Streptomyces sp. S1A1-8]QDO36003.1 IS200/IS605 family element transposase accessory protein TnpB [Streptomyces sp. S1A1-3]QDO46036.1 IS20